MRRSFGLAAFVLVAVGGKANAERPRAHFRLTFDSPHAIQDCSRGPRLALGDRFAALDDRGYVGEVTVSSAYTVVVYDGCGGEGVYLAPNASAPHRWSNEQRMRPVFLLGPLRRGQDVSRARFIGPAPKREHSVLGRLPPPRPGTYKRYYAVDLDGDGVADVEMGRLVCDVRRPDAFGGSVERAGHTVTRVRAHGRWRYTDVEELGVFKTGWDVDEPYALCPLEPAPYETEIEPQPRSASFVPVAAQLQR